MTFDAIRQSWLILGPPRPSAWDREWRARLLGNFEILCRQLWDVGITEVYLGGSFVEAKGRPDDIDGYFLCDQTSYKNRDLHRSLNAIAPVRVWTWRMEHRRPNPFGELRLPMWHQSRVELYPDYGQAASGPFHRESREVGFATLYRRTRGDHSPRGIVRLVPDDSEPNGHARAQSSPIANRAQ